MSNYLISIWWRNCCGIKWDLVQMKVLALIHFNIECKSLCCYKRFSGLLSKRGERLQIAPLIRSIWEGLRQWVCLTGDNAGVEVHIRFHIWTLPIAAALHARPASLQYSPWINAWWPSKDVMIPPPCHTMLKGHLLASRIDHHANNSMMRQTNLLRAHGWFCLLLIQAIIHGETEP